MGKVLRILLIFLVLVTAFLYLAYLQLPRIAIGILGKAYGLNISYRHADMTPRFVNGEILIDFDLKDVKVIKNTLSTSAERSYNSLSDLVAAPFSGAWTYERVSGTIKPSLKKLEIIRLTAEAKEFKLTAKGMTNYESKSTDMDIVLDFSDSLIRKIPKELSGAVLKDNPGGWKSLSVNIKGDFRSPSISITGRMFRLNIKELSN